MATKDINRSALEGGRPGRDKEDRRVYQRRERRGTKMYLKKVALDIEEYYKTFEPARGKIWRSFTDNLGPAYRWLDSNVGKSWSDVYSALREKFDPRTLAGHHLVNQHIIPSIEGAAGEEMEINQARFRAACKPGVVLKLLNLCTIIQDIYTIAEFCSCDVGYSGSCGCGNAVEREAYDAFEVIASAYDELIEAGVFVRKKEF